MLNRLLIFIIVITSNLFFLNVSSNDQLNFDVSQIEILDGGNKIIGKKITASDCVDTNLLEIGSNYQFLVKPSFLYIK